MRTSRLALFTGLGLALLAAGYAAIWLVARPDPALLARLWAMPLVGVFGAVIANASGTGGGVVFIPVFNLLRETGTLALTPGAILGASFLIQCFGMSMGSLTWLRALFRTSPPATGIPPRQFARLIFLLLALALPVELFAQRVLHPDPTLVLILFKSFSVALGLSVILTTLLGRGRTTPRSHLRRTDVIGLALLAPLGGLATAFFSVGLGEIAALYLFLRGYALNTCSAIAVILSAVSVLAGAPFHIAAGHVPWEVVALAGPGAMLGGFLARRIAQALGAFRLKLAVGGWIAVSGLALILSNVG